MPRVPQPTALKLVKGTRKDRVNTAEPIPAAQAITIPSWLDAKARNVWKRLAPDLIRQGVLTAWDRDEFAVWCDAIVRHREAAQRIAKDGVLKKGDKGRLVKHPAAQLVRDYAAIIANYGARFGLSPSDRSRITRRPPEGEAEAKDPGRLLS